MASRDDEADMTDVHKDVLTNLYEKLSDNIRVDGVLPKLVSKKVITTKEVSKVKFRDPDNRAEEMLQIIERGKDKGFYVLIEALRGSTQGQLAKLMEDEKARLCASKQAEKRKQEDEIPAPGPSKKAKAEPPAGVSGSQSDRDFESDVEGFDVSDKPYTVNVKPCLEQFYLDHRKEAYAIFKKPRGKALIINVKQVWNKKSQVQSEPRYGTDIDKDNLKKLLDQLFIDATVFNDDDGLTATDIEDKVREFASPANHEDSQCAVLALLSHGEDGYIYGTDGNPVSVDKLRSFLTSKDCSTLVGKPKLTLIQACRGSLENYGVDHPPDVSDDKMADHGDEIVGFSTIAGYKSWRNQVTGSWFISAVVSVFQKHAHHMKILDMMKRVNGIVRRKVAHTKPVNLQMPETHFRTCNDWYLFPNIQRKEK